MSVNDARSDQGRSAYEAESSRVCAIEAAIASRSPGTPIDFESARERELERVCITERSALFLERERRRDLQCLA